MTVEPESPSRFVVISDRDAPDADCHLPLCFDPAAVLAVVATDDAGGFALHLAGGQVLRLRPPVSAAVLKRLGLASIARAAKPRPARVAKPKRASKRKPAPAGVLPAIAAFVRGL